MKHEILKIVAKYQQDKVGDVGRKLLELLQKRQCEDVRLSRPAVVVSGSRRGDRNKLKKDVDI